MTGSVCRITSVEWYGLGGDVEYGDQHQLLHGGIMTGSVCRITSVEWIGLGGDVEYVDQQQLHHGGIMTGSVSRITSVEWFGRVVMWNMWISNSFTMEVL